ECLAQCLRRARAMRVRPFPVVAELRDCPVVPVGDEDRVVAEPCLAAPLPRELAFEHAADVDLLAARRKRDDLRDHARAPDVLAGEALEEGVGLVALRRPARRTYARAAVESVDLDAGVLAEHPHVGRRAFAPEARLEPRVLLVGLAGLLRPLARLERVEPPAGEPVAQLLELVRVRGGEDGARYRRQRTAMTSGSSDNSAASD